MKKLSLILLSLLMLSALISCQNESNLPALSEMTERDEKIFLTGLSATNQLIVKYQNNIPVNGEISDYFDYSTKTLTYTLSNCSTTVDLSSDNLGIVEVSYLDGNVSYKVSDINFMFPCTVSILASFNMEGDTHVFYSKIQLNDFTDMKYISLKIDGVSYDVSEINKILGNN